MFRFPLPILLLFISLVARAQQPVVPHIPHIAVTGAAEMQVVPDEIHISIDLRERGSGNNKVTVDKQEVDLKEAVKGLGLEPTALTLSDAMADLVPKKFRDDDVIARKGYSLKVADAEMVRKVFLELDRLQIEDASIHHVSHSKEVEYRRDMRIKAITAAKEKADYLLAAIGERVGAALEVSEAAVETTVPRIRGNVRRLTSTSYSNARFMDSDGAYEDLGVNFSRITIAANVQCVFAIAAR
ncbi:MAG: SIMPL domain-containing protein [Flavobacteriales bacterium]|nr:SIMPL domain-containing protein [Flavobacteriales bacterium]